MKFLVDAQIPRKAVDWLAEAGHDAIHTLDLPLQNYTPDSDVTARADADDRVVVTKDMDFLSSHSQSGRPKKLLLIATGNIGNRELETLFRNSLPHLTSRLAVSSCVRIDASGSISG